MSSPPRHLAAHTAIHPYDPVADKSSKLGLAKEAPCFDPKENIHPSALLIKQACCKHFKAHIGNCSGFLEAVVNGLLPGKLNPGTNADGIVAVLQDPKNGWTKLEVGDSHGPAAGPAAAAKAAEGFLVVAVATSVEIRAYRKVLRDNRKTSNGHVAIVVAGKVDSRRGYPLGFWGMKDGIGKANATLNYAFSVPKETDDPLPPYPHYFYRSL